MLTLPALHAFRDRFPEARIGLLGYPHIAELARERFYAHTLQSLEHRSVAIFFATHGTLDGALSRYFASFDLVVSYLYDPDEIFQTNLRRAGVRRILTADCRPGGSTHATVHLARWLAEVGISSEVGPPHLYPNAADQAEAQRLFPSLDRPTVALHPGSGSPAKNWSLNGYLDLAAWLRAKGYQVLVVTGLADSEVEAAFWKDQRSADCLRCSGPPLPVLAAVLQRCAGFVGNDSGVSHMAAAVGVPTVAIFGSTDPKVWEPRGKSVRTLRRGTAVAGVTLDEVKSALDELLPHRPA